MQNDLIFAFALVQNLSNSQIDLITSLTRDFILAMVKVENAILSPLLRIGSAGLVATRAANGKFNRNKI